MIINPDKFKVILLKDHGRINRTKYSGKDQVNFVEDSL